MALIWNWYEVLEGSAVSLAFVVAPLLIHAEGRHRTRARAAERRHKEAMDAHRKTHDRLEVRQ
jgi:hypothetical protein